VAVGPFQSDALLVPEHCVFDHVHNSRLCSSYAHWNRTALQSCNARGYQLQNFAILQPCGIDKFNGVEFVCCPRDKGDSPFTDSTDKFAFLKFDNFNISISFTYSFLRLRTRMQIFNVQSKTDRKPV